MKFQYFSDIHTEEYKSNPKKLQKILNTINVSAPYLILAGDIGDPYSRIYKDFLKGLSSLFQHIFLIAGNHEYYGKQYMISVQTEIRKFTKSLGNITYLENEIFHIPDTNISIFGATFWSDICSQEETDITNYISDYQCIPTFTVQTSRDLHQQSCKVLNQALATYPSHKFIVISHHLPLYSLVDPKYLHKQPSLNSAFASNILSAYNPQIVAWVAGHTHTPLEQGIFYINPLGYRGENVKYNLNKTFEICTT